MGQTRKRHDAGELKPHVRKNDEVVVLAGRSLGERGRVLSVDPQRERAVVEGVNLITKHQKPTPNRQGGQTQGGRIEKPAPIHVSNLMVVCPSCSKPTRVAHKEQEGKSVRACKHCGSALERASK
ncbi:MAG: 50S ribosomal protein L24 [Armatimonadota bacterium]